LAIAVAIAALLPAVGLAATPGDLDGDEHVTAADLALLIQAWRDYLAGGDWNHKADLDPDDHLLRADVVAMLDAFAEANTPVNHSLRNLFFLHHSVGNGIVVEGHMRDHIAASNAAHGTDFVLWDHGYNGDGLRDAAGNDTGTNYTVPDDNTNPDGLYALWTSADAGWAYTRGRILENHQVIAFKPCYPASDVPDDETLADYKTWYLGMRGFFDARQDKLFVVMSPPPMWDNSAESAKRARLFANWLRSAEYLAGHPNVVCFDLFNILAQPDDGSAHANRLRQAYYGGGGDSHPNTAGYEAAGAALAAFLCEAALAY
jgi:hypothetical protein